MHMLKVKSSNIAAVGYDASNRKMVVEFKSGAKHAYADVPPETHADLVGAESIGKHFHANVRNAFKSSAVEE